MGVYLVFFTLLATEHVFEHSYAAAIIGEALRHTVAKNFALLGAGLTDAGGAAFSANLYGITQLRAMVVSMKESTAGCSSSPSSPFSSSP